MLQSAKKWFMGILSGLFGASCSLMAPPVKFPLDANKKVTFCFANECCGPMEIHFSLITRSIDVVSVGSFHVRYYRLAAADWQKLFNYMQREFLELSAPKGNASQAKGVGKESLAIINQLTPIASNNGFMGHETIDRFLGMLKDTSGQKEVLRG